MARLSTAVSANGSDTGSAYDLTGCDREPIRIPGQIQPDGALFVVDSRNGRIVRAAIGAAQVCRPGVDWRSASLAETLIAEARPLIDRLEQRVPKEGLAYLGLLRGRDACFQAVAHRSGGWIVVELEQAADNDPASFEEVYPHIRAFLDRLQRASTLAEIAELGAEEVRRITRLDRAMVYRFDPMWNGSVVAESRNDRLPSYMDLRFPASDIPAQARDLYRLNRLRMIADANYTPVRLETAEGVDDTPFDLSYAVLRSVSPVHLEYMRNMGTMSSMSISLIQNDRLWGLISCHNSTPARVPYHIRNACDFIGQVLSLQLGAKQAALLSERRNALRAIQTRLLAQMAGADSFAGGLLARPADLLALTGAEGAAVVIGGRCTLVGDTPTEDEIGRIVRWLIAQGRADMFATHSLASMMPDGGAIKDAASGVLAIPVSQIHDSYLLWFRPEVIKTVKWSGDPTKDIDTMKGEPRISPRKSFDAWQETVRLQAEPWQDAEVEAAAELRTAIVDIVLRNAEEMAALNQRLISTNQELEAFSYSVSHDLRAPFRHIVGYAELLKKAEGEKLSGKGNRYIDTIVESAISAGTLVDNLLDFSQMGRASMKFVRVDMNALVADVKRKLVIEGDERPIKWRISGLPTIKGDPTMLRLVMQNLMDNALKFSRMRDPAIIEIGSTQTTDEQIIHVRDNGSGFDQAYVGKLFGVFQRLHRVEEFEGTGIGLANVKRIVERHGGRVRAEGQLDHGATFFVAFPVKAGRDHG